MRMKRILLILSAVLLSTGLITAQETVKLDSTVRYTYPSPEDSSRTAKEHYDGYTDAGLVNHVSVYSWNNGAWLFSSERSCTYDDNGFLLTKEQVSTSHLYDRRTEYDRNDDGTIASEILYNNKNNGLPMDPEWEKSRKTTYLYDASGNISEEDVFVFLNYWQGISKNIYDYNGDEKLQSVSSYRWFPKVMVKKYESLYTQNPSGSTNYAAIVWKVEPGTTTEQLGAYLINDSTEILNVYTNDGTQDVRYNLHGVGGKTLAAVLGGDNDENQVIDISQLRDDYSEWFRSLEDNDLSLISCNIKELRSFRVFEVIKTHEELYTHTGTNEYENTVYFVKAAATPDDLDKITLPDDITWVNVYLAEDPNDAEAPYGRVDIPGGGGKTLKELFNENGITIDQLVWDYKEWYLTKDGERQLFRTNVKAIRDLTPYTDNVVIHELLLSAGETDGYLSNAYDIRVDATADDLAAVTLPDTATWINVYINDGSSDQRISLYEVAGKTLKAVLLDGDNRDKVTVDLAQLRHDYREWFYGKDGKAVLINLNVKANLNLGNTAPVVVTSDLRNTGGDEYLSTAYMIKSHATLADLKNYTLGNIDFLSVYVFDGSDNVRINLHGVNGKTLDVALTGGNDEKDTIDLADLRMNYWEWFDDAEGKPVIVNLNVKAVKILTEAPTVEVNEKLMSEEGGDIFDNTAYLVKTSATLDDLAGYTVADDMEVLKVYARKLIRDTTYVLTGVAGKDLKAILTGDNDQGTVIDIADLKEHYAEWFFNIDGTAQRIKLNIKASRTLNNGLDYLYSKKEYDYGTDKMTMTTLHYDENGNPSDNKIRVTYYQDPVTGKTVMEVNEMSTDGTTWTPLYKVVHVYDKEQLLRDEYYNYKSSEGDYVLSMKTFYYYPSATAIRPAENLTTRLYPNPAGEVLYVTVSGESSFEYRIYSLSGRMVATGLSQDERVTVNVSSLPSGIYILRVTSEGKTFNGKFVKQ